MFVVGDIIARYSRMKGKSVFFPIASHYSGNTAHHIAEKFTNIFLKNKKPNEKERNVLDLYKYRYGLPEAILKDFTDPLNILDFYNQEILWELRSLDVSGNYEYSYTTKHKDFSIFINALIPLYKENRLLIYNKDKKLALNYDNKRWKEKVLELVDRTEFIQPFHKNNIISVIKNKNLRNDWGLLRKSGFGVVYSNKKGIVDPMFDSELFTIFDLYIRFKKEVEMKSNGEYVFKNLFNVLKGKKKPDNELEHKITRWLPCNIFICEEHLKNWVVKKLYAESAMLDKKYQTKKYFILGMGLLNGERISASRGNAIIASDLINQYGSAKARLIIIMQGGHPSKTYNYNPYLVTEIDKLLTNFTSYYTYLISLASKKTHIKDANNKDQLIKIISNNLDQNIEKGYYRQALIELFSIIPKKYNIRTPKFARELIKTYTRYLEILSPSLLKGFSFQN